MIHRRVPMLFALASMAAGSVSAQTQSLVGILECRSSGALTADIEQLAEAGRAAGFDCRIRQRPFESAVYCTGNSPTQAFGHRVREFNLAQRPDGEAVLSVAFTQPPSNIEPALKRAQSAHAGESLLTDAVLEQREDGVAELRCRTAGQRGTTGAIAGTLDFRGMQPVPPMRVCAAPIGKTAHPQCIVTTSGQSTYLIDGLIHGEYYVVAFPLERNPNRLFGVFSRPLNNCAPSAGDCRRDQLGRVMVVPGDTRANVHPDTWVPELPVSLRAASPGASPR